ncbi:hypothetical protein [Enterovibrio coralii]|uniref:Uncharacterized protein n=1 Tax=Enterovibrio coralii TaxID=294935 RepID=A0A135ICI7_9GAMM|nr:hypothetical protein [Enterovibrio coralii]KXF83173.1 hypothetical protein ATN88_05605 [Enterovibrio coralii]
MNESTVLSHFHKKQLWMASHIDDAQFPTPESQAGLAYYKEAESCPSVDTETVSDSSDGFSFYVVDCHPLMVRYARTLAQKWPEDKQETMIEYLSQLSLTDIPTPDGINVTLFVSMEQGVPVATGMLFETQEDEGVLKGIYDVHGTTDAAKHAMMAHLHSVVGDEKVVIE